MNVATLFYLQSMRNWNDLKAMMTGQSDGNYDVDWLKAMIKHHQAALKMSKDALAKAEHQELKDLASAIIKAQSAEITKMQAWVNEWSK